MNVVVCGCSFSSTSFKAPGKHWSELLEKKLQIKIVNMAQAGSSNAYIRLQLEQAKKIKPNYIIVNSTLVDRIEVPIKFSEPKLKKYNIFDFRPGVNQVIASALLSVMIDEKDPRLFFKKEKSNAAKEYFSYLYDRNWKRQVDQWLLTDCLKELYINGIKIVYDPWFLNMDEKTDHFILDDLSEEIKNKIYTSYEFSYHKFFQTHRFDKDKDKDPGYHLNDEAQELIAEYHAQNILLHIDSLSSKS